MADTRQRTTWGSRFRFLIRAVGLTGVAAVGVGGMLAAATLPPVDFGSWPALQTLPDVLKAAVDGGHGELAQIGASALVGGGAAVLVALVIELLGALFLGVGRRTVAGTAATVGVVAAVALLVIVNLYSFTHYARYDCTRDRRFTLKPELAAELGKLRASSPTTIVVHQTHNFGNLSPTRDSFTKGAEAEVTAKVNDLIDQFREFGPQFKVVVLDKETFEYRNGLKELTKDAPELLAAITAAPENSIFFHANKRVQRLAFSEFMQLDRTASDTSDERQANLVLVPQGTDTFARRILAVQERRPKAAVCVIHELLTTGADDPENRFTMAGLKKSLTAQGFDVVDVVLRNWSRAQSRGDIKPSADSREESRLDRLEGELDEVDIEVASARAEIAQFEAILARIDKLKGRPWDERKAFYQRLFGRTPAEDQEPAVIAALTKSLKRAQDDLVEAKRKKDEAEKKLAEALKDERPLQDRRMTDVAAKLTKQLADVDLLVVPRYTIEDAMKGPGIDATLHGLSKEQVKVVKEFMKSGKPVLACLGPITPQIDPQRSGESPDDFDKRVAKEIGEAADGFERLLAERGVELGRSVILFDGETRALAGGDPFSGRRPTEVPPLVLAEPPAADATLQPNPIAAAFRLTSRVAEQKLDVRLRAVRPVGLVPEWQPKQPFAAEIAFTTGDTWNELQPYPRMARRQDGSRGFAYKPKYEPLDVNDSKRGTRDEERRGPFPVAVAVENKIPVSWFDENASATDTSPLRSPAEREQAAAALLLPLDGVFAAGLTVAADKRDRPTQRTVVFGSGTVFSGGELKPPQEKLLLHTVNWLTNRADRLPKSATAEEPEWHYPRVAMSERDRILWRFGTAIGLPMIAAYCGLLAMMRRRMR